MTPNDTLALRHARFWQTSSTTLGAASLTTFAVAGLANTSIFNMWWVTYFIVTTLFGIVLASRHDQQRPDTAPTA